MKKCVFLLVLVLLTFQMVSSSFGQVTEPPTSSDIQRIEKVVATFFGLWSLQNCTTWTEAFSANSIFYHPNFPGAIRGRQGLSDFCIQNSKDPESTFRQNGSILLTPSGGFYMVLAPYTYAAIRPDLSVFINTGWESLIISLDFSILSATEFFDRSALSPPVFSN